MAARAGSGALRRWFRYGAGDAQEAARSLHASFGMLYERSRTRLEESRRHAKLYGGREIPGFDVQRNAMPRPIGASESVRENVVQQAVDRVWARMIAVQPYPMFTTDAARWRTRRRAQLQDRAVRGIFYDEDASEKIEQAVLDLLVQGICFVKVWPFDGRVRIERRHESQIFVDDYDGRDGQPTQIVEADFVDTDVLCAIWPKKEPEIRKASALTPGTYYGPGRDEEVQQHLVLSSWHRKTTRDATDGRYLVSIPGVALEYADWPHPFPFAWARWMRHLLGFWGRGIPEQIESKQYEANFLAEREEIAFGLMGVPAILVHENAHIVGETIDNVPGAVVRWSGVKPEAWTPPAIHPQNLQQKDRVKQEAFADVGLTQLDVSGQLPPGMTAGEAIRAWGEQTSGIHVGPRRAHERLVVQIAKLVRVAARMLAEEDGGYRVRAEGKRRGCYEYVDWKKDVDMPDDHCQIRVMPTSMLPHTPSGKIQTIADLMEMGVISRSNGARLIASGSDIEAYMEEDSALADIVDQTIETMVNSFDEKTGKGTYVAPEPFDNVVIAQLRAVQMYAVERLYGTPDGALDLLRRFIKDCDVIIEERKRREMERVAAAQATSAPPVPGAPPPVAAVPQLPGSSYPTPS